MTSLFYPLKRYWKWAVYALVLALVVGSTGWWWHRQRFVGTDDAFIKADTVSVASQLDGYVAAVDVLDDASVTAGQVLVRLDRRSAEAKVAQTQAEVQRLGAAILSIGDKASLAQTMIVEKEAALASARAQAETTAADLQRYRTLASSNWVSPQRLQTTRQAHSQASAAVMQAEAALEATRQSAQSIVAERLQAVAEMKAAQAAEHQALLDLERTAIRAPIRGVVGARSVRVGQYVHAGGALLSVVPLDRAYVLANFKETQISHLRVGQSVTIRTDAFPNRTLRGRIRSLAPATGGEFALIPVENGVGNFTKTVQRVPVRIEIDPGQNLARQLRVGLSVRVEVDTRSHEVGEQARP